MKFLFIFMKFFLFQFLYKVLILYSQKSALMYAVERNNLEIIKLLLANPSIEVNRKAYLYKKEWYEFDKDHCVELDEMTPLHSAVKYNNPDIVKHLIDFPDTDINCKTYYILHKGRNIWQNKIELKTALHIAVENGNYEMVKILINHPSINANIRSYKFESNEECQMTALHIASQKNQSNIVKLLLDSGKLDMNSKDNLGRTAYQLATDMEIKSLFDEYLSIT